MSRQESARFTRRRFGTAVALPSLAALAGCSQMSRIVSSTGTPPYEAVGPVPMLCFQNLNGEDVAVVQAKGAALKKLTDQQKVRELAEEIGKGRARLRLVDASGTARASNDAAYSHPMEEVFALNLFGSGKRRGGREVLRKFCVPDSGVTALPSASSTLQACFRTGTVLKDCPHLLLGTYDGGLALARDKASGKHGYLNPQGQFQIPPRFVGAFTFSEGLASVAEDKLRGAIDPSGKYVIAPKYDSLSPAADGWMCFASGERRGIVNLKGEEVSVESSQNVSWMGTHYALVGGSRQLFGGQTIWPTLLTRDKQVIALKGFEGAYRMPAGIALRKQGEQTFGWYDTNLKLIYDKPLNDMNTGFGDVTPLQEDGRWGLMTADRKWRVSPKYQDIGGFNFGLASFAESEGGRSGFISTDGTEIAIPDMDEGLCYGHFLYVDHRSGAPGFYTRQGKLIERVNLITLR